MINGMFITGIDFICASLALAYIGHLVFQQFGMHNSLGAFCSVAKVSLRDQHVSRRLR